MSDKHITDEEIHSASGRAPRMPVGVPKATCLNCHKEHYAFYAQQADSDCRINYEDRKTYAEWLVLFQRYGIGVLSAPENRMFPSFSKVVSGRQMMTQFLQSHIEVIPNNQIGNIVLRDDWYFTDEWKDAGFQDGLR